MEKQEKLPALTVDEYGIFDIEDETVIAGIAGGLSVTPAVLDNGCIHNKSECGVSK